VNEAARAALLPGVVALARAAGEIVLRHYRGGFTVRRKSDSSPVTAADEDSEAHIVAGLRRLTPDVTIISEEAASRGENEAAAGLEARLFWLVDPLDGTREFVARNDEFSINIALVEDRAPVLGVLHAPVAGKTYASSGPGSAMLHGADAAPRRLHVRAAPANGLVVLASRSHGDKPALAAYLEQFKVAERRLIGSAVKFGLIAEGAADLYARLGPTMEWDTAAGHAVLAAAGGSVTLLSGAPLLYGKPGSRNGDFVARAI
jgi:3'(2'), 5'-bisphosphate nucleotidase